METHAPFSTRLMVRHESTGFARRTPTSPHLWRATADRPPLRLDRSVAGRAAGRAAQRAALAREVRRRLRDRRPTCVARSRAATGHRRPAGVIHPWSARAVLGSIARRTGNHRPADGGRSLWLLGRGATPRRCVDANGGAASIAAVRVLRASMYEMSVYDVPTYVAVAALLCVVALFASWLPARRASRVDPVLALRAD